MRGVSKKGVRFTLKRCRFYCERPQNHPPPKKSTALALVGGVRALWVGEHPHLASAMFIDLVIYMVYIIDVKHKQRTCSSLLVLTQNLDGFRPNICILSQQGSSKVNFAYRTISGDSKEAEQ